MPRLRTTTWPPKVVVGMLAATMALVGPAGVAGAADRPSGRSTGAGLHQASLPAAVHVVASGLNQPKKITIGPDGDLYVALSGDGIAPGTCTDGLEPSCLDLSGAVDRVTPSGVVTSVLTDLPSISAGGADAEATGPSEALVVNGELQVLMQDNDIPASTGAEPYGPDGHQLGTLFKVGLGKVAETEEADFGAFEAANDPDGGAGRGYSGDPAIDSDPFGMVPYRGGLAVADAAANDVLFVSPADHISVLGVLPPIEEPVPAGYLGPNSPAQIIQAQAVPTALAVGPDGDLYVSGLGGVPYDVGDTNIYKLVPGSTRPQVLASGLTMVGDLAFDRAGRLLALEIDQNGIEDPSPYTSSGAIIRINANGTKTVVADAGLVYPTGMAVAPDGSIYVANAGIVDGRGGPDGLTGEIVRVSSSAVADQLGANYGGYREVASDGGIFTFGAYGFYGSEGGQHLNAPIVGTASAPTGPGYWEVASDGGIFTFGTAGFYGSEGGHHLNAPIVSMTPTPDGRGYWEVASDGGIFTFGDATFHGSHGGSPLNSPIVAMTATPDGGGYWLFAADGGVFAYGDAGYYGSHGGAHLNKPIVGAVATPDGKGYYLVASDGGVFTYGDARFLGSRGGQALNAPVVGIETTPDNGGYYLVAADGGVFTYGDADFDGSEGGHHLNRPIIALAS